MASRPRRAGKFTSAAGGGRGWRCTLDPRGRSKQSERCGKGGAEKAGRGWRGIRLRRPTEQRSSRGRQEKKWNGESKWRPFWPGDGWNKHGGGQKHREPEGASSRTGCSVIVDASIDFLAQCACLSGIQRTRKHLLRRRLVNT